MARRILKLVLEVGYQLFNVSLLFFSLLRRIQFQTFILQISIVKLHLEPSTAACSSLQKFDLGGGKNDTFVGENSLFL